MVLLQVKNIDGDDLENRYSKQTNKKEIQINDEYGHEQGKKYGKYISIAFMEDDL